jgi:hypothetical protein
VAAAATKQVDGLVLRAVSECAAGKHGARVQRMLGFMARKPHLSYFSLYPLLRFSWDFEEKNAL